MYTRAVNHDPENVDGCRTKLPRLLILVPKIIFSCRAPNRRPSFRMVSPRGRLGRYMCACIMSHVYRESQNTAPGEPLAKDDRLPVGRQQRCTAAVVAVPPSPSPQGPPTHALGIWRRSDTRRIHARYFTGTYSKLDFHVPVTRFSVRSGPKCV